MKLTQTETKFIRTTIFDIYFSLKYENGNIENIATIYHNKSTALTMAYINHLITNNSYDKLKPMVDEIFTTFAKAKKEEIDAIEIELYEKYDIRI